MSVQARALYAKKMEKIDAAEKNTNRMIIFTLIVYTFCRLPELVCYFFLIFPFYSIVLIFSHGPLIINLIQCLFVLSYSTNFFFYFHFNKSFNEGFKKMKSNFLFIERLLTFIVWFHCFLYIFYKLKKN